MYQKINLGSKVSLFVNKLSFFIDEMC